MSRVARVLQAGPAQPTANLTLFDADLAPGLSVGTVKTGQPGRRGLRYALAQASSSAVLSVQEAPAGWVGSRPGTTLGNSVNADAGLSDSLIGPTPERPQRERRWPVVRAVKTADQLPDTAPADPPPPAEVIEERCLSLLRANDAPDLPYRLAINPYRGCEHACLGCEFAIAPGSAPGSAPGFAPGATPGVAPDRAAAIQTPPGPRIYAKVNAADCLREELRRPGYVPRPINLGSATDAYQPVERKLRLTRALIEVLHEAQHPFALATRSAGVVRDLDLLADLAARRQVVVLMGLTTLDAGLSRTLEPGASPPALRLAAMRTLAQAGVWVGVNLAPLRVEIEVDEIEALLAAAAQAGARSVHWRVQRGSVEESVLRFKPVQAQVARVAALHGLGLSLPELDASAFCAPRGAPPPATPPRQNELF